MKPSFAVLVSSVMLGLALCSPAFAEISYENTLNTNGHAEVDAANDSMRFSAGMENEAKTLSEARQANAMAMSSLRQTFNALSIKGLKLKTTGFNSYPIWPSDANRPRPKKPVGYHVSNTFSVTVEGATPEQLADYGSKLVDSAIDAGASNVGALQFYLDDIRTHQLKALEQAVKNAKEQADIMAKAAGTLVSGVYIIEGTPQYNYAKRHYPMPMMARSMMADGAAESVETPIEGGEQTISADVSIRFKLSGYQSQVPCLK